MHTSADDPARTRRWQTATVAALFAGYAGYYVCRSNLSVAAPLMLAEYGPTLTKGRIGDIASFGVLFYAAGKFFNGVGTEYVGGRRMFLFGLFASVACTVAFAAAYLVGPFTSYVAGAAVGGPAGAAGVDIPVLVLLPFFAVWAVNRFVQSMGWGGLVQIAGRWFPHARLGTVMGILSMSYLVGDALARQYLGAAVGLGAGWRGVFYFAAASLGIIGVVLLFVLKSGPSAVGLPEQPPPPGNVYGSDTGETRVPLRKLLGPLFRSPAFWLVCFLNVGLTLIRETFNLWNPTYLNDVAKLSPGMAGVTSSLFPLVGGLSSFLGGYFADRTRGKYSLVMIPSLVGLTAALLAMAVVPVGTLDADIRPYAALGLIAAVAFFLLGPYTFCSGILALNIGGRRGGAASAGLIDTAGYLGATAAGSGIGRVADVYGWATAFEVLAGVAAATLLVAIGYAAYNRRRRT